MVLICNISSRHYSITLVPNVDRALYDNPDTPGKVPTWKEEEHHWNWSWEIWTSEKRGFMQRWYPNPNKLETILYQPKNLKSFATAQGNMFTIHPPADPFKQESIVKNRSKTTKFKDFSHHIQSYSRWYVPNHRTSIVHQSRAEATHRWIYGWSIWNGHSCYRQGFLSIILLLHQKGINQ